MASGLEASLVTLTRSFSRDREAVIGEPSTNVVYADCRCTVKHGEGKTGFGQGAYIAGPDAYNREELTRRREASGQNRRSGGK